MGKILIAIYHLTRDVVHVFPDTKEGRTEADKWLLDQARKSLDLPFASISEINTCLWSITPLQIPNMELMELQDGIVSAEKKQEYIDHHGVACPFCGSTDVEADGPKVSDYSDDVFENTACNACGKKWKDIYQIVDIVKRDGDEEEED